jgi:DNA-binding response OmpR family regulator
MPDIYTREKRQNLKDVMIKHKLVLLVDDEPALLTATKAGLRERGFRVEAAESADAAMKAIHKLKPSVVVSDLVMPGTNGFELFQQVKMEKEFTKLPFVFLTGMDDYYAKKFGKEIGGAAYITKPVDLDELEAILREQISKQI